MDISVPDRQIEIVRVKYFCCQRAAVIADAVRCVVLWQVIDIVSRNLTVGAKTEHAQPSGLTLREFVYPPERSGGIFQCLVVSQVGVCSSHSSSIASAVHACSIRRKRSRDA
jgi:hypothetical protein